MPSHILAIRTCTFAQFPRSGGEGACAAGHRESGQTSRPATAREDSVRTLNQRTVGKGACCLPGQSSVPPWPLAHLGTHRYLGSCKVLQASADVLRTVAAIQGDNRAEDDLGSVTCRVPAGRMGSRVGSWGWMRQWKDL